MEIFNCISLSCVINYMWKKNLPESKVFHLVLCFQIKRDPPVHWQEGWLFFQDKSKIWKLWVRNNLTEFFACVVSPCRTFRVNQKAQFLSWKLLRDSSNHGACFRLVLWDAGRWRQSGTKDDGQSVLQVSARTTNQTTNRQARRFQRGRCVGTGEFLHDTHFGDDRSLTAWVKWYLHVLKCTQKNWIASIYAQT